MFRLYIKDNSKLLNDCFDFDWKCSKIEKLLTSLGCTAYDIGDVYEGMRFFYPNIKNTYKHFSSFTPASGIIPCLGSNSLAEIIMHTPGLLDRVNLNLSKIDLHFVSTNATRCQIKELEVIKQMNPDKFIIRYQFMELLVHMAKERYAIKAKAKNKVSTDLTIVDAI